MIALGESQQAIDLITLTGELHRRGDLEAAGGAPLLASLADGMPASPTSRHYATHRQRKSHLRNLIHATHKYPARAFEGEDGADAILDNAESSIFQLAEDRIRVGLLPIKDIVRDQFRAPRKKSSAKARASPLATGYVELDKLTSGLQPSELLILAARPSPRQKPRWPSPRRKHRHPSGQPVAVFTSKMSKESLLQRLVASVA